MNAMAPCPPESPLMKAWEAYQTTDDFKNSLIWATALRYTDAGNRNFEFDAAANQITNLQREQHAKGSLWAAFMQGWQAAGGVDPFKAAPSLSMTEAQIKHMADRFLGWKLPENFSPDAGISFNATFNEQTAHPMKHEPSGTNLFDATQAAAMVRYMIEGL